MDETTARRRLQRMVSSTSEPTLTVEDIDDLVELAKLADPTGNPPSNVAAAPVWAPSTTYTYGTVVTANPAAGRWWRCLLAGVSGTTQPTWPAVTGTASGAQVIETGGVVWEDAGGPWAPTWDLHAAAAHGWETKAGMAAEDFRFAADGQDFARNQIIDHCQEQARIHRRRTVASAPMTSC